MNKFKIEGSSQDIYYCYDKRIKTKQAAFCLA